MNQSTAVFLVNDNVRGIYATYELDGFKDGRHTPGATADKILFKTFDQSIEKGNLIIVPTKTRHGFTICKVIEVDVEVDVETPVHIDWVAGVFDPEQHNRILKQESTMLDAIKSAEKNRKRKELRESLLADAETKLLALPIAKVKDVD